MLILDSITFGNIGRFVEPQTICIDSLGKMTQIEGKNNNTGGSSGSAKSTTLKALDFLMGVNNVPVSVLQSRLTEDHVFVCGKFQYNGKLLKIERGKKLSIDLDGVVTSGSSKMTEDLLDQIIGMPRDLFRKTMHKRQGEGGFFLQMTPSEIHKFLTSCLGLKAEQAKILQIDELLSSLNENKAALSSALESNRTGLEATNNAIDSMPEIPILDIGEDQLIALEMAYNKALDARKLAFDETSKGILEVEDQIRLVEKKESDRQNLINAQIFELKNAMNELKRQDALRQREVERKLSDIRFEKSHALQASNIGKKAKENAKMYLEELKKIRTSQCPTCDQHWMNDASKAKEIEIGNQLKSSRNAIIEGTEADNRLAIYEESIQALNKDLEPKLTHEMIELDSQIASLFKDRLNKSSFELESEKLNKNLAILRENRRIDMERLDEIERAARLEYDMAKKKIEIFNQNHRNYQTSKTKLTEQVKYYSDQIVKKQLELDITVQQIEDAEDAKKLIKSYLSCSFDDALESIGNDATEILRSIPNMATATISLEGLKENADGKIKEEVNAVISMDGEIGIPIKSLSGGEKSSADLAIDLAAVNFIEEKTGQGINIMGLDEFTNGLDTVCIQEVMEMLKSSKLDKKILLVEHNPIVSQSIENKIVVERNGLTSRIIQN